MFYINNNPILASEMEVLNELKSQLAINGIERFAEFKVGVRNIQFNCPIHGDGQERKPSCGISTTNQEGVPSGTVHCFSCGYTNNLEGMVSHCFGYDDMGAFGRDWLIKNFLTISIENRKDISLNLSRGQIKQSSIPYISEEELNQYRYYHDYMYQRKLTNEIIELFDVGYDPEFMLDDKTKIPCITFPVRDKKGNTLFIARRAINLKLFHYPEGVDKPLYGVYELPDDADEVIICESILNTLTCYVYGKPAIALNGTGTAAQYEELKRLPIRKIILALDNDDAGQKGSMRIVEALKDHKIITQYDIPKGKDINDLTESEFKNLIELF